MSRTVSAYIAFLANERPRFVAPIESLTGPTPLRELVEHRPLSIDVHPPQGTRVTDALLILSFGGPEGPDDVMPFLENVTRGRNIPPARLLEVAAHYQHFGGVSPINAQNRALQAALVKTLRAQGDSLPVYWGNRNWKPFLGETLKQMTEDGITRAFVYATSAFGSDSGCKQYRENLRDAAMLIEGAPELLKLRLYFDHPSFIEAQAERVKHALLQLPEALQERARIVYTAHSVPMSLAVGSPYEPQLREAARLVTEALGRDPSTTDLVWQSRSGPPHVPWLAPDIVDHLKALHAEGAEAVVVVPIGFVSDHMEVVWDLDHDAKICASTLGLAFARAGTVGDDPRIIEMLIELIDERRQAVPKRALSMLGIAGEDCAMKCCPRPVVASALDNPTP